MDFIIYSGGGNGYDFYKQSEGFPESYKAMIKELYTTTALFGSKKSGKIPALRFAPIDKKYLITVLFKEVTGNNETRNHSAAVNWLLNPKEADKLLNRDLSEAFSEIINNSIKCLVQNKYVADYEEVKAESAGVKSSRNRMTAMFSALEFCEQVRYGKSDSLQAQVFIGIDPSKENYFDCFNDFFSKVPAMMKKHLSFYIGAQAASDSYGVALTVFEKESLERVVSGNDFSGAMPTKKVILIDDTFTTAFLPEKIEDFININEKNSKATLNLFNSSEDWERFSKVVHKISHEGNSLSLDTEFFQILGDEFCAKAVTSGCFNENIINALYKQKKVMKNFPLFNKAVESSPAITAETKKQSTDKEKKTTKKKEKRSGGNGKNIIIALISSVGVILAMSAIYFIFASNASDGLDSTELGALIILLTAADIPLGYLLISTLKKISATKKQK